MKYTAGIPGKSAAIDRLRSGEIRLPPVAFDVVETSVRAESRLECCDALVSATWGTNRYTYALRYRNRSTPKAFAEALSGLRDLVQKPGTYPMLMVPYLSPQQLTELEITGISGIDLCGNGVVIAPGQLCVVRTGQPNRYPQSEPIKNVYRGNSSIVARVFLARPRFDTLQQVAKEIETRFGRVTLPTVSKVVSRLDQDLCVRKSKQEIRLLQPESLLERLVENYRPPRVDRRFVGECDMETPAILEALSIGTRGTPFRCMASGSTSLSRYAIMAREQKTQIYCSNLSQACTLFGTGIRETSRFANVEFLETSDDSVYFDARVENDISWAPPTQVYLELMTGDKRDRETAEQVRGRILEELRTQEEQPP